MGNACRARYEEDGVRKKGQNQLPNVLIINGKHRHQRTQVKHKGEKQRPFAGIAGKVLVQGKVSVAGDGQKLGSALDDALETSV